MNSHRAHPRYGAGPSEESAEAELVGRVESVGPEPTFLSGLVPAVQAVRMTVTDVRRGAAQVGDSLEIDVLIVAGNPHVAVGASGLPALDPAMVQPGVLVAAWANAADGRLLASTISTDGPSSADGSYAGRRR